MYLLYLDDSGSVLDPKQRCIVLGGVYVFERQAYWLTGRLDELAEQILPDNPSAVEFHAYDIFAGKKEPWNRFPKREDRQRVILDVLNVLVTSHESVRAFACVVDKQGSGADPMETAFQELCLRFDTNLVAHYKAHDDPQRGLLVLDKSSYESSLQRLALSLRDYNRKGTPVSNLAEVPLFVDSKASRIVQLADHVAYAVFRRYDSHDATYLDPIQSRFAPVNDDTPHFLVHRTPNRACTCPACLSRKIKKLSFPDSS